MSARKIKSAERTLSLFELFSREQHPFTVTDVSRALRMPQPSVSMLLRNLRDLGYLEYDRQSRSFMPSIRVALLGSWIGNRFSEAAALRERLGALQRKTSETTLVAIQNVAAAQYVLVQPAQHPDKLEVDSGQFRSLTCSATGRVLLSLKCDEEIVGWVKRCNAEAVEPRFKVRLQEFMALMKRVREQGYAETAGDITPGAGAFAMAIPSPMGRMPLAVAVGGPLSRISGRRLEIVKALREFKDSFAGDSLISREGPPVSNDASRLSNELQSHDDLLPNRAGRALRPNSAVGSSMSGTAF